MPKKKDNPTSFKPNDPRLIGNNFGKNGGAPRTISPPEEEMIILGKEMIKWIEDNDPYHLSEWHCVEKMMSQKEWERISKLPEFVPYYNKALRLISRKYVDGTVPPPIAQRWLRLYFKDLKDEENEEMRLKAEIDAQAREGAQLDRNITVNLVDYSKKDP
jgi:hypothetical protein